MFRGGEGYYDHYTLAAIPSILSRSEFLTAYHSLPAGDFPGHSAVYIRVSDNDGGAYRNGGQQRINVRRRYRCGRSDADDGGVVTQAQSCACERHSASTEVRAVMATYAQYHGIVLDGVPAAEGGITNRELFQ